MLKAGRECHPASGRSFCGNECMQVREFTISVLHLHRFGSSVVGSHSIIREGVQVETVNHNCGFKDCNMVECRDQTISVFAGGRFA